MRTTKLLLYTVLVLLMGFAISACEGTEGPEGPAGADGVDGTDGIDGVDGNANFQTYVYNSPEWNIGGPVIDIDMAGILTDDLLENDVILSYVKHTGFNMVSSIPGPVSVLFGLLLP